MNIISFAWTTDALLKGKKTVTRRNWSFRHAMKFHAGQIVSAYSKSPRYGGTKVGEIEIVSVYRERLCDMPIGDVQKEGGLWKDRNEFIWGFCKGTKLKPTDEVYVIRFRVVKIFT